MGHSAEHHIEHAEHAAHASHDVFDRQVTISIAIVAAVLAAVTLLGHRAHTETLRLQGESLRMQGEALRLQTDGGVQFNQAANRWAQYQAYNIRMHTYLAMIDHGRVSAVSGKRLEDQINRLEKRFNKDEKAEGDEPSEPEQTAKAKEKSKTTGDADWQKVIEGWKQKSKEYLDEKGPVKKLAEEYTAKAEKDFKEADEFLEKRKDYLDESVAEHHRCDRFDVGEIGLQIGVVLCSLAILTKRRGFWHVGLLCAVTGALIASTGYFDLFMEAGHHAE